MARASTVRRTITGVHLWLLLSKATRAQEAQARRSVESLGLCMSDFGALEVLHHKGPLPVDTIRKKILISSGSMTAAVDRLERQGLVQRKNSATDRRARIAHLTTKGTALIEQLFAEHAQDMEQSFSCLNRKEKETLAELLRKLAGTDQQQASLKSEGQSARKRGKK